MIGDKSTKQAGIGNVLLAGSGNKKKKDKQASVSDEEGTDSARPKLPLAQLLKNLFAQGKGYASEAVQEAKPYGKEVLDAASKIQPELIGAGLGGLGGGLYGHMTGHNTLLSALLGSGLGAGAGYGMRRDGFLNRGATDFDRVVRSIYRRLNPQPSEWAPDTYMPKETGGVEERRPSVGPQQKISAELTTTGREHIKSKNFAIPSKAKTPGQKAESGNYPIPDAAHARNALARVSQHGTSAEKAEVREKVHEKFPGIGEEKSARMLLRLLRRKR